MIAFLLLLNLVISAVNAYSSGRIWAQAQAKGGFAKILVWSALIMSVCGFMYVYTVPIGWLAASLPATLISDEAEPGAYILSLESFQALLDLTYTLIILPVLGSGAIITVHSWKNLSLRRKNGTADAGDYLEAGWNTYALVHNSSSAYRVFSDGGMSLGGLFDDETDGSVVIVLLLLISLAFSILSTVMLFRMGKQSAHRDHMYKLA